MGKGYSVLEIITKFEEVTGLKVKREIVGRRDGDIAEIYADITKAKKELTEVENKMKDRIDFFEESLSEIRAGRANPAILNRVMVEYYGTPTPINQVSSVSVPEARQILIQPWDMSILKAIERAIIEANLGINPQNDGKCIRLVFPELTEERRKDIVKEIKELTENTKVLIRNIRREAIDGIKKEEKNKEISEDDLKKGEEEIQKVTDKFVKIAEEKYEKKCKEIMTI